MDVFIEQGQKKIFAGAVEWPGWSRSGKTEADALQALLDFGPRYARVVQAAGLEIVVPKAATGFQVTERHPGDSTTDFGAPSAVLEADRPPLDQPVLSQSSSILQACWAAFDRAVDHAEGRELRKGPRGGGRDLDRILDHVLQADLSYLRKLAWKYRPQESSGPREEIPRARIAILDALQAALRGELPERGPRGGVLWPPRYFIRRVTWHVLDHVWEIEDRML